ncbi:MAG: hypothetical protein ACLFN5_05025 [bacterium]
MRYPRLVALIYLERLKIEEKGHLNGPYMFYFDISYPRPSVSGRLQELVFDEKIGEEVDFSTRTLRERLIFKEIIEGPFSLGVSMAPADRAYAEEMTEVIKRFGAEVISNFVNLRFHTLNKMMDLVQSVGITNFEKTLTNSIATGTIDVIPLEKEELTLKIPLVTPNNLRNPYPDRHRRGVEYQKYLKKSGDENGFVELKAEIIER